MSAHAPSRRSMFAGGAAALLAGAAITAAHGAPAAPKAADAALLALCEEFHQFQAKVTTWPADDDDGFADLIDQQWRVAGSIDATRATSDAGRRAKASVALVVMSIAFGDEKGRSAPFVLSALRDIAGTPTTTPSAVQSADAAICALADAILANQAKGDRLSDEADKIEDFKAEQRFIEERINPLVRQSWDMRADLAQMQATTMAGFLAKARVVQSFNNCAPNYANPYDDDAMAWSLANDMLGVASLWASEDDGEDVA